MNYSKSKGSLDSFDDLVDIEDGGETPVKDFKKKKTIVSSDMPLQFKRMKTKLVESTQKLHEIEELIESEQDEKTALNKLKEYLKKQGIVNSLISKPINHLSRKKTLHQSQQEPKKAYNQLELNRWGLNTPENDEKKLIIDDLESLDLETKSIPFSPKNETSSKSSFDPQKGTKIDLKNIIEEPNSLNSTLGATGRGLAETPSSQASKEKLRPLFK